MFFVGLRRTDDLSNTEAPIFRKNLRIYEKSETNGIEREAAAPNQLPKVLFAEIYVRFHKEYSASATDQWNIAYYKVATFDVLQLK